MLLSRSVAEWLGSPTCDQYVAGSNPGRRAAECNPGPVVYTHVPLLPSSIIWYRPMGGVAMMLGGWGGNRGPGGKCSLPPGLWLRSTAGWLPRTGISPGSNPTLVANVGTTFSNYYPYNTLCLKNADLRPFLFSRLSALLMLATTENATYLQNSDVKRLIRWSRFPSMCKSFLQPYRRCVTIIKPHNYIWQDFEKAVPVRMIYYFTFYQLIYTIYLLFARSHKCDNHM